MSLDFVAIAPHPPIIIPEVGGKDTKKCQKTILAMEKLSKKLAEINPETIIVISPHALIHTDRFAIYASPKFFGDFRQFGAPNVNFHFENDLALASAIAKESNKNNINAYLFGDPDNDYGELDHGEMVPLYYLIKNISSDCKIIPIAFSYLNPAAHFSFGQIINDVANSPAFRHQKIALVASGDLSHRLAQGAPAGYAKEGKEFDEKLIKDLKNKNTQQILEMDSDFIEAAGECGYRSILIALGALDNTQYSPEIISYEGPFGVGYLVANFKIKI